MLRLSGSGDVLSTAARDRRESDGGVARLIRQIADGGTLMHFSAEDSFAMRNEANGALRSKTEIVSPLVGSGARGPTTSALLEMRLNGVAGSAGDDGFVFAGEWDRGKGFMTRYRPVERDADDPDEGEGNREIFPRENEWRLVTIASCRLRQRWPIAARRRPRASDAASLRSDLRPTPRAIW